MNRFTLLTGLGLFALPSVALADGSLADCADAADNDGDGLVDLNDVDCDCGVGTNLFENIESFINQPQLRELQQLSHQLLATLCV